MKKVLILLALLIATNGYASDYLEPRYPNTHPQIIHNYQKHKPPRRVVQRPHHGQPIIVYTGSTVITQDHYDVYKPTIIYHKADSFTNTTICTTCK